MTEIINNADNAYHNLLKDVIENGELVTTRAVLPSTGRPVGAYTVFGRQVRYNLREGFPLLTTKKVSFKLVAAELLWFLSGSSKVQDLYKHGAVRIWDEWATKEQCAKFGREEGDLGPIYGPLWRRWEGLSRHALPAWEPLFNSKGEMISTMPPRGPYMNPDNTQLEREWNNLWSMGISVTKIDQIANVIQSIKKNPNGRRHIVTGWNPATCDNVSLPPCHTLFQFNVSHSGTRLNCQLYQRSGDIFLGIPFNIASYALLTHMIAQVCGLEVGEFIHSIGDLHLYENHVEQAKEQLSRASFKQPFLALDPGIKDINKFELKDIQLAHYESHPAIKAEVAV